MIVYRCQRSFRPLRYFEYFDETKYYLCPIEENCFTLLGSMNAKIRQEKVKMEEEARKKRREMHQQWSIYSNKFILVFNRFQKSDSDDAEL